MIVPFDLAKDASGQIVVGRETQIACDKAIRLFEKEPRDSLIVAMAGHAGSKWNNVWMAKVIKDYVCYATGGSVKFLSGKADTFNTSGEMKALARAAALGTEQFGNGTFDITLVVKWWHAPRARFLCRFWLRRFMVRAKVSVQTCESHVHWQTIVKEFCLAWPKNLVRVAFARNDIF
jgi:hypothetical protein